MSRDNFFVQLKGIDGKTVYVHLDNITHVEEGEVKDGKTTSFQTVVHLSGGGTVVVQESMMSLIQKTAAYGVAKVM